MNPGAAEEGAKVAGGIVDSLKSQPLSLALVVMNLALLAVLYFILIAVKEQRATDMKNIYENQKHIVDLVSRCTGAK